MSDLPHHTYATRSRSVKQQQQQQARTSQPLADVTFKKTKKRPRSPLKQNVGLFEEVTKGDGNDGDDAEEEEDAVTNATVKRDPYRGLIIGKKFKVVKRCGGGSFGEIYCGQRIGTGEQVAVKIEPCNSKHPQLVYEAKLYRRLLTAAPAAPSKLPPVGVARIHWYGTVDVSGGSVSTTDIVGAGDNGSSEEGGGDTSKRRTTTTLINVLVMDMLGPSLETLLARSGGSFSLKTVLQLTDQLLERLEMFHSHGYIHRDIKPDNFLMHGSTLYIVDFGLSKRFQDPTTGVHIPFRSGKHLTGTPRYASIRNHAGSEQSRRDDLESVAYMFIYFCTGKLPWQGLRGRGSRKYKLIEEKKREVQRDGAAFDAMCAGVPSEFGELLQYAWSLNFEDTPNYARIRSNFAALGRRKHIVLDNVFDWD